jgi:hypothetical protein
MALSPSLVHATSRWNRPAQVQGEFSYSREFLTRGTEWHSWGRNSWHSCAKSTRARPPPPSAFPAPASSFCIFDARPFPIRVKGTSSSTPACCKRLARTHTIVALRCAKVRPRSRQRRSRLDCPNPNRIRNLNPNLNPDPNLARTPRTRQQPSSVALHPPPRRSPTAGAERRPRAHGSPPLPPLANRPPLRVLSIPDCVNVRSPQVAVQSGPVGADFARARGVPPKHRCCHESARVKSPAPHFLIYNM